MPSQGFLSLSEQLTQKARAALELGRPTEAVPLLLQALTVTGSGSEGAVVMERLSYAFGQTGDKDAALLWAERAVAASPDWCWAHLRRADALDNLKRVDEAINAAHTALGLEPELPWIYRTLARFYLSKKEYAQAEENANRFQELAPDDADAYYYLADVALNKAQGERNKARRKKLLDQAEKDLRIGLSIEPASPYLQRLMGRLRRIQGKGRDAIPYYIDAVRGLPSSSHEQNNAWCALITLLIEPMGNVSLLGWLVQGAGVFLGWGAWAAYGAAVLFVSLLQAPFVLFPQYVMPLLKAFRRLPTHAKSPLLQMVVQRKKLWHFGDGITGFCVFVVFGVNLLPVLLRGLWSAGVWAFHFWKHG